MENIKNFLFGISLGIILLASLGLNIVLHESGHFTAAKIADLNPKMHFFEPYGGGKVSSFTPNFFVTYGGKGSLAKDFGIAFAGPLVNLIITLFLLTVYFVIPKEKRTLRLNLVFAMLIVPSLMSFVANMLPIGFSDGSLILNYLK